jgi:hypothetical protein
VSATNDPQIVLRNKHFDQELIQQRLDSRSENLHPHLIVTPISNIDKLKMLFYPDTQEVILFLIALFLSYIVVGPSIQVAYTDPALVTVLGLISISLYTYRWRYSSIFDAMRRREKAMQALIDGEKTVVVELKLIGMVVSLIILYYGFSY